MSLYLPVNARSVPLRRRISYCSGLSSARHSLVGLLCLHLHGDTVAHASGATKAAIATKWTAAAAITSTWKISWYPNVAGQRDSAFGARRPAPRACRAPPPAKTSTVGATPRSSSSGHRDDADPAEGDEDERGQPLRCVHPREVEHEPSRGAAPDDDQDHVADPAVEREQRERRVRAGDQQQDRRVVEPAHPRADAGRAPVDAVIERADPEHRRERDRVDPRRDQLPPGIRERHEHRARRRPRRRTRTGGRPRAGAASARRPRWNCALHSTEGPLAQLVEQGTFNPKVAGSIPARPIGHGSIPARPIGHGYADTVPRISISCSSASSSMLATRSARSLAGAGSSA